MLAQELLAIHVAPPSYKEMQTQLKKIAEAGLRMWANEEADPNEPRQMVVFSAKNSNTVLLLGKTPNLSSVMDSGDGDKVKTFAVMEPPRGEKGLVALSIACEGNKRTEYFPYFILIERNPDGKLVYWGYQDSFMPSPFALIRSWRVEIKIGEQIVASKPEICDGDREPLYASGDLICQYLIDQISAEELLAATGQPTRADELEQLRQELSFANDHVALLTNQAEQLEKQLMVAVREKFAAEEAAENNKKAWEKEVIRVGSLEQHLLDISRNKIWPFIEFLLPGKFKKLIDDVAVLVPRASYRD